MLMRLRKKIAQSTAEYAILIGIVIAAVAAMQTYVKRTLQARIKDASDTKDIQGDWGANGMDALFSTRQYEPYYLVSGANAVRATQEFRDFTEGVLTRREERITGSRDSYTNYVIGNNVNEYEMKY